MKAGVRDDIARVEIVRALGHHVIATNDLARIGGIDPHAMGHDRDMRVQARNGARGTVDLGDADILGPVQHLSLQIGQRNLIVIDDPQRSNPGGGKILQGRRAQTSRANDEDARRPELLLTRTANALEDDVAGVTLDFFR